MGPSALRQCLRVTVPATLTLRRSFAIKMSGQIMTSLPRFVSVEDGEPAPTRPGSLIRVVSYNILAQAYVKSSLFPHSPKPCLKWKARSEAVLTVLNSLDADFFCIQELDEYESFYRGNMDSLGYSSVYIQRNGKKRDGCGIFYKGSRTELVLKEEIEYNDLANLVEGGTVRLIGDSSPTNHISGSSQSVGTNGRGDPNDPYVRLKRDCVGILAAFRLLDVSQNLVILVNTHLYWDPEWADVKLAQAKYLLFRLRQFKATILQKFSCEPPVIITGDFNSTPGDKVYQFMLSGDNGDKVSNIVNGSTLLDLPDESPITLSSLYASVKGEPPFTNCTPEFTGTLDYIFFSDPRCLKPVSILQLPGPESADVAGGLPNYNHPSDHLPIGADFQVNDLTLRK